MTIDFVVLLQIREADILVVAIGQAKFVKGDWIKPGAVVIDCGINSITGNDHPSIHSDRIIKNIKIFMICF